MQITTIGLDLAKHIFQVHGIDANEGVVEKRRLRRGQVLSYFAAARAVRACTESSVLIHGSGGWRRERPAMTAPLSQDLRGRIARLVEQGSSVRAAAERFEVSPSAAIKLMQRVRATGSTAPAKIGGYRRPILEPYAETLRSIATSRPGITLKEMREALHDLGIEVKALSTVAEMLQRLGLTHKKRA